MEEISKLVGARIRGFRKQRRLSQEELAERCELHPTYIGQLERGEKNPTIESIQRVAIGLDIPIEQLFINISSSRQPDEEYIPDKILRLISELSPREQQVVYDMISEALKLKN